MIHNIDDIPNLFIKNPLIRIRYLPTDLSDLYERDKTTFCCFYDQVRSPKFTLFRHRLHKHVFHLLM